MQDFATRGADTQSECQGEHKREVMAFHKQNVPSISSLAQQQNTPSHLNFTTQRRTEREETRQNQNAVSHREEGLVTAHRG